MVWDAPFPELPAVARSQHEHAIRAIDIELPIERDQRPKSAGARTLPERRAVRGAQRGYFTDVIHVEDVIGKNRLICDWARVAADGFTPELLAVTDAQRVQHLHFSTCSLRAGHVHDAMLNERRDRRGYRIAAKCRRASDMPEYFSIAGAHGIGGSGIGADINNAVHRRGNPVGISIGGCRVQAPEYMPVAGLQRADVFAEIAVKS